MRSEDASARNAEPESNSQDVAQQSAVRQTNAQQPVAKALSVDTPAVLLAFPRSDAAAANEVSTSSDSAPPSLNEIRAEERPVFFTDAEASNQSFRITALLWFAGMLLFSVPMVTLLDVSVARWFAADPLPREFANALELMRVLSHGSGVFLILFAIFLMAPQCRWHIPRLATLAIGAGAIATLGKMFVLRPRPTGLNLDVASYDTAWLWAFDWKLTQVATFDASTRAFPSGNMATATALIVGLWIVLPRGRMLFGLMFLGTVLQSLDCSAHFPSDVLGGAAFGLIWAYACLHPKLLGNLFDKMHPESEKRANRRRGWERGAANTEHPTAA